MGSTPRQGKCQTTLGFPGGSDGKELACNVGDLGSIPGLGRSPEEGSGNSLQCSCLENFMDRGAWQAIVHGVTRVGHDWGTDTYTHAANTEEDWLAAFFYTLLKSQNQISWENRGNLPLTVRLESREIGQNSQTAERSLFCASPKGPPRAASLAPITSGGRDEQQLGLLEAETRARRPRPVLLAPIRGPLLTAQGWGGGGWSRFSFLLRLERGLLTCL